MIIVGAVSVMVNYTVYLPRFFSSSNASRAWFEGDRDTPPPTPESHGINKAIHLAIFILGARYLLVFIGAAYLVIYVIGRVARSYGYGIGSSSRLQKHLTPKAR